MSELITDQVTAIIPTLSNTAGLIHLIGELERLKVKTVVVDNGQQREIENAIENKAELMTYLPQNSNLGFAKAINLGAIKTQTKWLWILNDDIEGITRQLVDRLISTTVKHNWVAVSPILVKPTGERENIGYRVLPVGKVELNYEKTKSNDQSLDGLTAAALLINREVFNQLKGFDESFFAYLEDVDLFLRLKEAGYHFGADTEVSVIHHHQTTSSKMKKGFKQQRDMINWWRIVFKHPKRFILKPTVLSMLLERGRNVSGYLKAR